MQRPIASVHSVNWEEFNGSHAEWDACLASLGSLGLHQCHAWGEFRRTADWTPFRIIARATAGQVHAACQALVRRVFGVSFVWVPGGASGDLSLLDERFISFFRKVFGAVCYFRINDMRPLADADCRTLAAVNWSRPGFRMSSGLTMEYDLAPESLQRLSRASGNWRHNLKRSAKYGLRIEPWLNPDAQSIAALYREMEEIKGNIERIPERDLAPLIQCLGERLLVCRAVDTDGRILALRGAAILGNRAWVILAAAGATARKNYATYATFWSLAEACRARGVQTYDLGGVDPERNKGVYDFKKGTGAQLVHYLGEWDCAVPGPLRQIANWCLRRRRSAT